MYVEILEDMDNYLYNTDKKTETQNKVGSGQGCQARFGPQLPGGLCLDGLRQSCQWCQWHYREFRASQVFLRAGRKKIVLSTLLLLSRIMPDLLRLKRTEWLWSQVTALRMSELEDSTCLIQRFLAISISPEECLKIEIP